MPAMGALQRAAFEAVLMPMLPAEFEFSSIEAWERSLADVLADAGVRGLVKEDKGLSGLVIYGTCRDADAGSAIGEIRALFAHPDRRRTGIGRELVTRACEELAEMGYAEVTLWSLQENDEANAFYEALGFERDGTTQVRERLGAQEARYRRSL